MQKTRNGKSLLIESCSSNAYVNLTNVKEYAPLVEKATTIWARRNLDKLDESVRKEATKLNEGVNDSTILTKVVRSLQEKGLTPPTLYKFPISKVNTIQEKNINGRVYTDALWENVLTNQRSAWQYNTGLTDHPEDDGHFMDQGIVWLEGIKENGIVYGIGALVGEARKLAEEIMSVGGKIGFSTAGYGEVLDEGVVDPDTYEIERFADLVLNPSQGVFGNSEDVIGGKSMTTENKENTMKKTVNESVKAKSLLEDEEVEDQNEEAEDQNTEDEEGSEEAEGEEESEEITESEEGSEEETEEETEESSEEESTEETEEDSEETLSEQLIRDHYVAKINEIAKLPGRQWEDKIKKLESTVKLVNKENLSEKTKAALNAKVSAMVENIMKETSKVISQGYDAKEVCESIGITDIKILEGVQDKMEEFASLNECFAKSKKEVEKYKSLYEAKETQLCESAKENFDLEKQLKEAKNTIRDLSNRLLMEKTDRRLAEDENKELKAKVSNLSAKVKNYDALVRQYESSNKVLRTSKKAIAEKANILAKRNARNVAEKKAYEESITNFNARNEESSFLRENSAISGLFESAGKNVEAGKKFKTVREAENSLIFDEDILNEEVKTKRENVSKLSDLFN